MAGKPREPSQQLVDEATRQAMRDDGWVEGEVTFLPEKTQEGALGPGRRPRHKWARIDAVLGWYRFSRALIPRDKFIESLRKWCAVDNPGITPPDERTLRKRIEKLAKKP